MTILEKLGWRPKKKEKQVLAEVMGALELTEEDEKLLKEEEEVRRELQVLEEQDKPIEARMEWLRAEAGKLLIESEHAEKAGNSEKAKSYEVRADAYLEEYTELANKLAGNIVQQVKKNNLRVKLIRIIAIKAKKAKLKEAKAKGFAA